MLFLKKEKPQTAPFCLLSFSPRSWVVPVRNRLRRLLSDTLRSNGSLPNMPSCDTVVVVTKKIPEDLSLVEADFMNVLRQARLL